MVVVFDACLFYPIAIRHFSGHLAAIDDFQARWTRVINEEWIRSVCRNLGKKRESFAATLEWLEIAVPDYLIEGYEGTLGECTLPDPDDFHVIEAAVFAEAERIITFNLADFPETVLLPLGLRAQNPDEFFVERYDAYPERVIEAAAEARAGLTRKPFTPERYVESLAGAGLTHLARLLTAHFDQI